MSHNNMNNQQDWVPVTLHGRGGGGAAAARPVLQRSAAAAAIHRAENDEKPRIRYLSTESIAAIQEWRRTATKTQRELDQMCSFPPGTVGDLEGRRRAPTPKQLNELSRTVRVVLTLEKQN
jgi:hypothetical protein